MDDTFATAFALSIFRPVHHRHTHALASAHYALADGLQTCAREAGS
jgi:hypothetical protein